MNFDMLTVFEGLGYLLPIGRITHAFEYVSFWEG